MAALRALLFANGVLPDPARLPGLVQPGDLLIAADGGSRHLLAAGLLPAVVIGDLDSLAAAERARLEAAGARLIVHPRDKDRTDLDLAIDHALQSGARVLRIVGALGGRLDQTLANLALLTRPDLAGLDVRMDDGLEEVWFVRTQTGIHGAPGEIVSLLPWGAPAFGVTTEGLRWPLRSETLHPGATRSVSNELLGRTATVTLASGLLLIVHRRSS